MLHFRDAVSALLPPPRDDEPATLRQDIVDELGDHLACAYNRELLRGVDSNLARQRVLERFGDPAAVARRLWFDAMRGKIMAQRVLIASCVVVTVASLSLVGLVWIQSNRAAAETIEANRKLSEALAQAQTTNKDMLSKLSEMSEAIRNPRSLDWNAVKFMVTDETPDGPPAAGCSISLFLRDSRDKQIFRTSDASGIADFGLVHPGEYFFGVSKNWDRGTLSGSGQLNVEPGSQIYKRIVCPKKVLERVPLRIRCDWPADLEKEGLVVDTPFRFMPIEKDGTSWNISSGMGTASHSVLCGPGAALKEIRNPMGLYVWASFMQRLRADILTSDVRAINEQAESLKWERGTYRLSELIVLRPDDSPAGTSGRHRFEILARCYPWHTNYGTYEFRQQPPSDEELRTRGGMMVGGQTTIGIAGVVLPKESWSKVATSFDARPDRVNEWTITLPEELIKAVRGKLKADGTRKPQ